MKGPKLRRGSALLFGLWFAAAAFATPAAADNPVAPLTKEQWRQDLRHLARELPRRHQVAPGAKVEWLSTLKDVPLYRQRLGELMWFKALPDSQTVYLNLKVYPDRSTFERVSGELLKQIDASQPKRLVIDVRQSNGGDFLKFRNYLLRELKQRPAFARPGGLYVVIGRGTISAAMVNAIDLRKELNAVLVGEPSVSKPNSYSENDEFTLPNSRIEVSCSVRDYKLQDEETPSLMPDKVIESTCEVYPTGRDQVLEWIPAQPLSR